MFIRSCPVVLLIQGLTYAASVFVFKENNMYVRIGVNNELSALIKNIHGLGFRGNLEFSQEDEPTLDLIRDGLRNLNLFGLKHLESSVHFDLDSNFVEELEKYNSHIGLLTVLFINLFQPIRQLCRSSGCSLFYAFPIQSADISCATSVFLLYYYCEYWRGVSNLGNEHTVNFNNNAVPGFNGVKGLLEVFDKLDSKTK